MLNTQNKPYDVIIFGATGFTGQLVAEYFAKQYPNANEVKWAIAARDIKKLDAIKAQYQLPEHVALIEANADDQASIQNMVQQAAVVLTTVGPYQLYGESLVKACVEAGVGYVDLCGEPTWMHQMIAKYQQQAQQTGAKLVFSCGFDSVPFDLGVYKVQQNAIAKTGKALQYVKGRVRNMQGSFSGGTAASFKATMKAAMTDPSIMAVLRNPYALASDTVPVEQPNGDKPYFDEALQSWVAPFIMATINTRNIHRSNMLLGHLYGADFCYDEMLMTGPGEQGEAIANAVASDKSMASDKGPKPGEGPSKEERENGSYDLMFTGTDSDGNEHRVSVSATLDPGYGSTSKIISECALCLIEKYPSLQGGFYTSAPALGSALIERLSQHAGLSFKDEM